MAAPTTRQPAMVFVDGSNLLIEMGSAISASIRADRPTDEALNLAAQTVWKTLGEQFVEGPVGPHRIIRKYWFGSIQGSEDDISARQRCLRGAGYEGVLFHKTKGRDEKGVDLAVAREMLIHGFHRNYETAVMVAGDEDYLGLVQDVKRMGLVVVGVFFDSSALSPSLRVSFDHFIPLYNPVAANANLTEIVQKQNVVV